MKIMKKVLIVCIFACIVLSFSSCATIIGGARYHAKVQVPGHPNARITVNGRYWGNGEANLLVPRKDADKLTINVQDENCEQQTTLFTSKVFRGWSFAGTILGWTGMVGNFPLPWGIAVDAATGAWWKPDITEKGVSKIDYDHFLYTIDYQAIPTKEQIIESKENAPIENRVDRLIELKKMLDEGILTQEEFDREKTKILNAD